MCGCAVTFIPRVKPVLSQYLEPGVFICCSTAETQCIIVNCVAFGWQFCCKNECKLILWKVWYGIIIELLFKRLIQTTKHKCRFHDHFSTFLFTAIYEFETRKTTRSVWQVLSQLVFLRNWTSFVICQTDYVSDRPFQWKLPHKTANSDPNPYFRLFPVAHSSWLFVSLNANILCLTVWPD